MSAYYSSGYSLLPLQLLAVRPVLCFSLWQASQLCSKKFTQMSVSGKGTHRDERRTNALGIAILHKLVLRFR